MCLFFLTSQTYDLGSFFCVNFWEELYLLKFSSIKVDRVAERLEIKKDSDCSVVVESKEVAKNALEKEKISPTTYSIAEVEK